jgi:hypothetical protein
MVMSGNRRALRDVVTSSVIVAYKENVGQLERTLRSSGLNPSIYRAQYTKLEEQYAANTRCLMSHHAAWQIAKERRGYTMICEADFVPCVDVGSLATFWPLEHPLAWGYLYQGSPRLLAIIEPGKYLRGHCAPAVAYVINSSVAELFTRFFEDQMKSYDPFSYFTWEAHLQWWAMGQGTEAYIPMKHYGEHGGAPNPEHSQYRSAAHGGKHRADNLIDCLAFTPLYASRGRTAFARERFEARALGWCRLLTGRWIVDTNVYSRTTWETVRMYAIGLRRLLS